MRRNNIWFYAGTAWAIVCLFVGSIPAHGASATGQFFPRGMFETHDGTHTDLFKSLGFNTVNVSADKSALDVLQTKGMKGVVWLGDYNNSTCQWEQSDSVVTAKVSAIKAHPVILAYFLADEPEQALETCPNVGTQIKARSDLVKAIDSTAKTYILVSNSAYVTGHVIEYYPYSHFVGVSDILGLDIYPCPQPAGAACDLADIDRAIAKVESLGVQHYWAVLQDFEDSIWRRPTPAELNAQFDRWLASRMEGYFIFSWDWQGNSLDQNVQHQDMVKLINNRTVSVNSCNVMGDANGDGKITLSDFEIWRRAFRGQ